MALIFGHSLLSLFTTHKSTKLDSFYMTLFEESLFIDKRDKGKYIRNVKVSNGRRSQVCVFKHEIH